MRNLFVALICIFLFGSCQKEEPVEKHTLQLEYVDYSTREVLMYDETLHKDVEIYFDEDVFRMTFIEMLHVESGAEFTLYYSGGNYYSL